MEFDLSASNARALGGQLVAAAEECERGDRWGTCGFGPAPDRCWSWSRAPPRGVRRSPRAKQN